MAAHGFINIREWGGSPDELALYSMVLNTPIPLPSITNQHLTVDVAPFMGGRALRIIHNATGECVTAYNVVQSLVFPFGGGEDTRVGGNFAVHEGGPMVQAEVAGVSENKDAITLTMQARGLTIERRIALDPDRPVVVFTITATNPGDKPAVTRVRSHLELNLGDLASTRMAFQNLGGETLDADMRPVVNLLREGQMFHADTQTLPAGEWAFSGSKGLRVTQRFDPQVVDLTWVYAYPEEMQDLEIELWRVEEEIPPGQSVTLRHELEIQPAP